MCLLLLLTVVVSDFQKPTPPKDPLIDYQATLNDILSKGVTPETNANALLWQAMGPTPEGRTRMPPEYFKRLGIPEPPTAGEYFIGSTSYARDVLKLQGDDITPFQNELDSCYRKPWKTVDFPRVAAYLKANEKPLQRTVDATKRTGYYNPLISNKQADGTKGYLIGALMPNIQKCRELASCLVSRAMLRTAEGQVEEAWQDLMACHRLGRLVARGGTLIEALVGIAIDAIASNSTLAYIEKANLSAAKLRVRMKDFESLPDMPRMADKIDQGERHFFLDSLQMIRSGGFAMLDQLVQVQPGKQLTPEQQKTWESLDWTPVVKRGNQFYDRMVAAARLPTRAERVVKFQQISDEFVKLKKQVQRPDPVLLAQNPAQVGPEIARSIGDILLGLLVPAIQKVCDAEDRSTQTNANVRIALALAMYHQALGQYPDTLQLLTPMYIANLPGDVFTGRGLVYRREGPGYVVYSLGLNGKDDGGRWMDDEPPGDDVRVRLPIVLPKR